MHNILICRDVLDDLKNTFLSAFHFHFLFLYCLTLNRHVGKQNFLINQVETKCAIKIDIFTSDFSYIYLVYNLGCNRIVGVGIFSL